MLREYRGALFFLFMKRNMHEKLKTPPCPRVYLSGRINEGQQQRSLSCIFRTCSSGDQGFTVLALPCAISRSVQAVLCPRWVGKDGKRQAQRNSRCAWITVDKVHESHAKVADHYWSCRPLVLFRLLESMSTTVKDGKAIHT